MSKSLQVTDGWRLDEPEQQFGFERYSKANLGCGDDYRRGSDWLNVDLRTSGPGMDGNDVEVDFEHDLNHLPWPFPDDNFERVVMDNVLEHLDDHLAVLRELHRVTEPGGTLVISGPHWNSASSWIDPTHTRPFDYRTFRHYLVEDMFSIEDVSVEKARWARPFPDDAALWFADTFGHGVVGFTVTVEVLD